MASETYLSKLVAKAPVALGYPRAGMGSASRLRQVGEWRRFLAECLTCSVVVFFSCILFRQPERTLGDALPGISALSIVAGLCWAMLLSRDCVQHRKCDRHPIRETAGAVRVSLQLLFSLLPVATLLRPDTSWLAAVIALVIVPPVLTLVWHIFATSAHGLRERSVSPGCIVMYGASGDRCQAAFVRLSSICREYMPVVFLDEDLLSFCEPEKRTASAFAGMLRSVRCELLILVSIHDLKYQDHLIIAAQEHGAPILYESDECRASDAAMGTPLGGQSASARLYIVGKRALDLVVSSACLLLFSPLLLMIAILIRLDSKGPALFVQERVGANGDIFRMYKFRSMIYSAARYECSPSTPEDPRISRIGRFLRRTSLDELPQLLNVFFGQMSLVGPRPEMPFIVDRYSSYHRLRLQIVPGITGLWQLSKDRAHPIHQNLHHDLAYMQERSFSLDVAILIHTLLFALRGGI